MDFVDIRQSGRSVFLSSFSSQPVHLDPVMGNKQYSLKEQKILIHVANLLQRLLGSPVSVRPLVARLGRSSVIRSQASIAVA